MQSKGLYSPLYLALLIWGLGLLWAPNAICDPQPVKGAHGNGRSAEKRSRHQDQKVERSLRMKELEIYGDVEKPKTMFVIPRASLRYSRRKQEKDFTNEILNPISREWIEDMQRWRTAVPPP